MDFPLSEAQLRYMDFSLLEAQICCMDFPFSMEVFAGTANGMTHSKIVPHSYQILTSQKYLKAPTNFALLIPLLRPQQSKERGIFSGQV